MRLIAEVSVFEQRVFLVCILMEITKTLDGNLFNPSYSISFSSLSFFFQQKKTHSFYDLFD